MNCKNLKLKLNHQLECKLLKKVISIKVCNDCPFKALKEARIQTKLKAKANSLAKLEKSRFSLFTKNMDICFLCGRKKDHLHEVIFGKNRKNSMTYGLVLPLCSKCHKLIHSDSCLQLEYKRKGQLLFSKAYPDLVFENIFHKNYLD